MTKKIYFKVKIVNCVVPEYWYAGMIGKIIKVKEPYENSWGLEARNGSSIFRRDVEILSE